MGLGLARASMLESDEPEKIHQFNRINERCGYPPIEIHSPLEVIYAEDEDV